MSFIQMMQILQMKGRRGRKKASTHSCVQRWLVRISIQLYCWNEIFNAKHSYRYRLMTCSFLSSMASSGIFCFIFARQSFTNWSVLISNGTFAAQPIYWINKMPFFGQMYEQAKKQLNTRSVGVCQMSEIYTFFYLFIFIYAFVYIRCVV